MHFLLFLNIVPVISAFYVNLDPGPVVSPSLIHRDTVAADPPGYSTAIIPATRPVNDNGSFFISNLAFDFYRVDGTRNGTTRGLYNSTISLNISVSMTLSAPGDPAPWTKCSGPTTPEYWEETCDVSSWSYSLYSPESSWPVNGFRMYFCHAVSSVNSPNITTSVRHEALIQVTDYFTQVIHQPIAKLDDIPLPTWCQTERKRIIQPGDNGAVDYISTCKQSTQGTMEVPFDIHLLSGGSRWPGTVAAANGSSLYKPTEREWKVYFRDQNSGN